MQHEAPRTGPGSVHDRRGELRRTGPLLQHVHDAIVGGNRGDAERLGLDVPTAPAPNERCQLRGEERRALFWLQLWASSEVALDFFLRDP